MIAPAHFHVNAGDPTRTKGLRESWAAGFRRRYRALEKDILAAVDERWPTGPQATANPYLTVDAGRLLRELGARVDTLIDDHLFEGSQNDPGSFEGHWQNGFLEGGWRRGVARANTEMNRARRDAAMREKLKVLESEDYIAQGALFEAAEIEAQLNVIYGQKFDQLKGITGGMSAQIKDQLALGYVNGAGVRDVGRAISKEVGLSRERAITFAHTELIRTHHQANVSEYSKAEEDFGFKVFAEWVTAGDDRVCQECADNEVKSLDEPYTLDEIRDLIPLHPRCRCVAVPVVVDKGKKKPTETMNYAHSVKQGHATFQNAGFTPTDKLMVGEYAKGIVGSELGGYTTIQEFLRTKGFIPQWILDQGPAAPDFRKYIAGIDTALTKSVAAENTMVWRGVRDILSTVGVDDLSKIKPGLRYKDAGYTSATTNRTIATKKFAQKLNTGDHPKVIEIELPKGQSALPAKAIGLSTHEAEVILPRGLEFEVVSMNAKTLKVKIVNAAKTKIDDVAEEAVKKKVPIAELPNNASHADTFGAKLRLLPDESVGGSTGARVYVDDEGAQWIVKHYSGNETQVQNEWIANRLYAAYGANVPEARIATIGGQQQIALKRVVEPGLTTVGNAGVEFAAGTATVQKKFVVDAWLANWDTAGMGWDNMIMVPGSKTKIWRIDQGGSLLYRAQGTRKGVQFGSAVDELASLRDPNINNYTAKLFAGVDDSMVEKQIWGLLQKSKELGDDFIEDLITASGMTGDDAATIATTLKERQEWLSQWRKAYNKANRGTKNKTLPSQGNHPMTGPVTPAEARAIQEARANGRVIPRDGPDIEDHAMLFNTEINNAGVPVTRAWLKLTESAQERLRSSGVLKSRVGSAAAKVPAKEYVLTPEELGFFDDDLRQAIIGAKANAGALREKDVDRAIQAVARHEQFREVLENAVGNKELAKARLAEFDAHYDKWIKGLTTVLEEGEGAAINAEAVFGKEFFQGYPTRESFAKQVKKTAASQPTSPQLSLNPEKVTNYIAEFDKSHPRRLNYSDGDIQKQDAFVGKHKGVSVRYHDNAHYKADQGALLLEVEGQDAAAAQKLVDTLKELGVSTERPTAAQAEELYLRRVAWARKTDFEDYVKTVQAAGDDPDARLAAGLQWWENRLPKRKSPRDMPGYNPAGTTIDPFGNGHRAWDRFDLTDDAFQKLDGQMRVIHQNTNGSVAETIDNVLNNGGLFISTVDKIRKGVPTGGMSPWPDLESGGASYFFTRLYNLSAAQSSTFKWKPSKLMRRTDAVSYNRDKYGSIGALHQRKSTPSGWIGNMGASSSNETNFKHGLSIFDCDEITVSYSKVKSVIDIFKKHGYQKWPDGRELRDVIKAK